MGAAINAAVSFVGVLAAIWGLWALGSDEAATDEVVARLSIAAACLLILAIQYLYYMWSIPAEWADGADQRIVALEAARKPKLAVYLARTSGEDTFRGGTAESFTGNRQTVVMPGPANALSLVVRNDGDIPLHRCVAELISAECVEGEKKGPIQIFEPIYLPWNITDSENNLSATIKPRTKARVWIAHVTYNGFVWIARVASKLPAGYQQIFGPSGRYHAVIQLSDGVASPVQVKVEICGSEGRFTKTFPSGSGKSSIAILEQGSPHLSPLDIQEETQPKTRPG